MKGTDEVTDSLFHTPIAAVADRNTAAQVKVASEKPANALSRIRGPCGGGFCQTMLSNERAIVLVAG